MSYSSTKVISAKKRNGAVLLAVLGLVFLLSVILVQFLIFAKEEVNRQGLEESREELRLKAYSALEFAFASLEEYILTGSKLYSPTQGWGNLNAGFITEEENYSIQLKIADETGKISLLNPNENLLDALFNEMQFSLSESGELKDSLLDWMDGDNDKRLNGAERFDYQRETPPYEPFEMPLTEFSTLKYIDGFKKHFFDKDGNPNDHYTKFTQAVTLYHDKPINLNTASELALKAVLKQEDQLNFDDIDSYLKGPDDKRGTKDDKILKEKNDFNIKQPSPPEPPTQEQPGPPPPTQNNQLYGIEAQVFKIEISVKKGDLNYLLTAITEHSTQEYPFSIIKIIENNQSN